MGGEETVVEGAEGEVLGRSGGAGTLIQVVYDVGGSRGEIRGTRILKGVLIGMLVVVPVVGLIVVAMTQLSLGYAILIGVAMCGMTIWSLVALSRRSRLRVRESVAAARSDEPGAWMAGALAKKKPSSADAMIAECFGQMAALGMVGTTMCVSRAKDQFNIVPIAEQFEPVALDEAEDPFVELMEATGARPAGDRTEAEEQAGGAAREEHGQVSSERRSIRRLKSRLRQFGGWGPLAMAGVFSARYFVELVRFGRVSVGLVVWTAVIATWVLRLSGSGFRRNQWFAVPGGVAIRKAVRGSHAWDVWVFSRRDGLLCAFPSQRKLWVVLAHCGGLTASETLTRSEVELLLRAWLSPLSPPEAGMLSDLV